MRLRNHAVLFSAAVLLAPLLAAASPSGVVISGFQLRGPAGGNDEYIELRNTSAINVDISGWKVQGCANGTPGSASNRATVNANVILKPGQYYLFTNNASGGYSGIVPGDQTYSTGISDFVSSSFAGIQLIDAANQRQDGVGAPSSPCREGTGVTTPTANSANNAFARNQDTENNVADFSGPRASAPHASGGITLTCLNDGIRIFAIQGRGHVSPYVNKCVSGVPGIVTQVIDTGFFMQDGDGDGDPGTSDGIFVFTATPPTVGVGQQVKVEGNVSEFRRGSSANLSATEIVSPKVTPSSGNFSNTTIVPVILGAGGRIPPNRVIDDDTLGSVEAATQTTYDPDVDAIDFYESLEGMLVQVNNARVVGPANSFGEIWVVGDNGASASGANARGGLTVTEYGRAIDFNPERIQLDVGLLTATVPAVNVADTTPVVVGAFTYDFGNYRLLPRSMPAFTSAALARATARVATGIDRLRIASYNVENLDPNDNDTCDGAPDRDIADGRFTREAQQIVNALLSPDILAIEELQDNSGCVNDGTVAADVTLNTLIQAIVTAGGPTYAYALIDPVNNADGGAPGANIRQAFLYNTATVSLVPGSVARIDPANSAWTASRKPLVATFVFNARRVTAIANHFNSKGGDDPLFGRFQPPVFSTETKRIQQATIVHNYIANLLAADAGARVVTLGDFNDFEFSAPMRTLTGEASGAPILTDLATVLLPPEERYSYVFEGNSQELDHILVSASLVANAEFQPVHVNSEYYDQVSDHDPLVASFKLLPPPPVADAGRDVTVTHLTVVNLDASASFAGDGTALRYQWVQTSGAHGNGNVDMTVELTGADTASPTFQAPAQYGELTFQLTVTDRFGMQATSSVTVKVTPGKPGK